MAPFVASLSARAPRPKVLGKDVTETVASRCLYQKPSKAKSTLQPNLMNPKFCCSPGATVPVGPCEIENPESAPAQSGFSVSSGHLSHAELSNFQD